MTWGPDRSLLYVDGEIEASYDGNASPAFIATNYAYLNHWGEGRTGPDRPGIEEASYHGLVDELHLSDIQRTAEEIRRHADCARSEPGR